MCKILSLVCNFRPLFPDFSHLKLHRQKTEWTCVSIVFCDIDRKMVALFFQTVFKAIGKLDFFFILLLKVYNLLSFLITNFVKASVINSSIFEISINIWTVCLSNLFFINYKIRFVLAILTWKLKIQAELTTLFLIANSIL